MFVGKGFSHAATAEMTIVKIIVLVPLLMSLNTGVKAKIPLITKLAMMAYNTSRSVLAIGIMIAKNMPYSATLRADTIDVGSIPPAMIPAAHPDAQKIPDIKAAE